MKISDTLLTLILILPANLLAVTTPEMAAQDASNALSAPEELSPKVDCIAYDGGSGNTTPSPIGADNFCKKPYGTLCAGKAAWVKSMRREDFNNTPEKMMKFANDINSGIKPQASVSKDSKAGGAESIQASFLMAKDALKTKVEGSGINPKIKGRMLAKLEKTWLNFGIPWRKDSDKNPEITDTTLASGCGQTGMHGTAWYNGIENSVNLCMGKILNSLPADIDTDQIKKVNMKLLLLPTFAHELGHALDGINTDIDLLDKEGDEVYGPMEDCMKNSPIYSDNFRSMFKTKKSKAEIRADYWSNVVIGDLKDKSEIDQAIQGRGTLCSDLGGNDHPLTTDRLMNLRNFPSVTNKLCPAPLEVDSCYDKAPIK